MGRVFILKKAVLKELDDILTSYYEGEYGREGLEIRLRGFRDKIDKDELKPQIIEINKK